MSFYYKPLTASQKIKDLYPKVNEIGQYLQEQSNNVSDGTVQTIYSPDLSNILNYITNSGTYYVTNAYGVPYGVDSNGFLIFERRSNQWYKMYYSPNNSNNIYTKTVAQYNTYDWVKIKFDEGTKYNDGNTLNITSLSESTIEHAYIQNPPESNLSYGWVDFRSTKTGNNAFVTFKPDNSDSIYVKTKTGGYWSTWIEYPPKSKIKESTPVDISNNNYFKYVWRKADSFYNTFKGLAQNVPQGYHTFFCEAGVTDNPSSRDIRGTILVDYQYGSSYNSNNKVITLKFTDTVGIEYVMVYDYNNGGWQQVKKTRMSTKLWEGKTDLTSSEILSLDDSINNYDVIEVLFYTKASGTYRTLGIDVRNNILSNSIVVRDINLTNNGSDSGVEFFEGYLDFLSGTTAQAKMSKSVILDGKTNATKVNNWGVDGIIHIIRITGITSS